MKLKSVLFFHIVLMLLVVFPGCSMKRSAKKGPETTYRALTTKDIMDGKPSIAPRNNQTIKGEKILSISYNVSDSWGNTGKGMKWHQTTKFNINDQGNWTTELALYRAGAMSEDGKTPAPPLKLKKNAGFLAFKDFAHLKSLINKSRFMEFNDIKSQNTPNNRPYSTGTSVLTVTTATRSHTVKWLGHSVMSIDEISPAVHKLPDIKRLFIWMDKQIPRFN